jgi:hypothetical protein
MKHHPSIVLASGEMSMKSKQNSRVMWIVIALVGCSLALIALAGQVVSAQPLGQGLKPPFKFAQRPMPCRRKLHRRAASSDDGNFWSRLYGHD